MKAKTSSKISAGFAVGGRSGASAGANGRFTLRRFKLVRTESRKSIRVRNPKYIEEKAAFRRKRSKQRFKQNVLREDARTAARVGHESTSFQQNDLARHRTNHVVCFSQP